MGRCCRHLVGDAVRLLFERIVACAKCELRLYIPCRSPDSRDERRRLERRDAEIRGLAWDRDRERTLMSMANRGLIDAFEDLREPDDVVLVDRVELGSIGGTEERAERREIEDIPIDHG